MGYTVKKSSKNKKVRNARKRVVDGIKFKSNLEVYTYKLLKEEGIEAPYESKTFTLLPSFSIDNECYELFGKGKKRDFRNTQKVRHIKYTPDFPGKKFIIECKGHMTEKFPNIWKSFKKYLSDNNLEYVLFLPRNQKHVRQTIDIIKRGKLY